MSHLRLCETNPIVFMWSAPKGIFQCHYEHVVDHCWGIPSSSSVFRQFGHFGGYYSVFELTTANLGAVSVGKVSLTPIGLF